ncbi:MAG: phosphohistidine phosphatase SixA [Chthoniobacterales bacterium]|jgi:phosphohistidine phosphatase
MKKFLYLVRHGEADWPGWDQPDDERPLTKRGRSEVKKVAKFLRRMGAEPLLIFTSPLPRAKQTAQILAEQLCLELGVEEDLGKGFDAEKFRRIVTAHDVESIVLVGHEPDFTRVIFALTGGDVVLAKAGVALVELEESAAKGILRWLFPPRFAKRR